MRNALHRKERRFHAKRGTTALECNEQPALRCNPFAVSSSRRKFRNRGKIALDVKSVGERGEERRDQNAGNDRTAGERGERTEHQRRAPNAAPAFTGGIQEYWRSGCSRWRYHLSESMICPKPRKVSISRNRMRWS